MKALIVLTVMAFSTTPVFAKDTTELATTLYEKIERASPKSVTGDIIQQALAGKQDDPCFEEMKPEIETMVKKYSKVDAARELAISEYASQFSSEELEALIYFAELPIGQKWFSKQPEIAAKAANVAMNHFQQNQYQISQQIMEILDKYRDRTCSVSE